MNQFKSRQKVKPLAVHAAPPPIEPEVTELAPVTVTPEVSEIVIDAPAAGNVGVQALLQFVSGGTKIEVRAATLDEVKRFVKLVEVAEAV